MEHQNTQEQPKTLISAIEQIVNIAIEKKLGDEFHQTAQPYVDYLAERMELTAGQALLFALFLEKCTDRNILISDFSDMLGCRTVHIISMMSDADVLVKRSLLKKRKDDDSVTYRVPMAVVEATKNNVLYKPESSKGLNIDSFFDYVSRVFDDDDNALEILFKLQELVEDNLHLEFCKVTKQQLPDCIGAEEQFLFYLLCNRLINEDDDNVCEYDWDDYYSKSALRRVRRNLKEEKTELQKLNLIENVTTEGIKDNSSFRLTQKAKEEFFAGMDVLGKQAEKSSRQILSFESIAPKTLYYNSSEEAQIKRLTDLLTAENFTQVTQRLSEGGMRKGFACLFYGAPGTGKTETVYQLARQTQRNVMVIDVAQIKSCWVGESEKNIKQAFDRYRHYAAHSDNAPILLFNEADAVLGIRQEGAERAVDKMENAIQNIILQEMESLEGIMIATTNLTQNLDKAFERRFIYKIEFTKPSREAKQAIWQSMIPSLDEGTATRLATQFDFSGGQIENIARKRTVETIISGIEPDAEQMIAFCRAETLSDKKMCRPRIGY